MWRDRIRALVAGHRDNPMLAALARSAEKYMHAYNNQRNWSISVNGEQAAFSRLMRGRRGCVMDVGANRGDWANMAKRIAPDSTIHCFELSPITFELLRQNTAHQPAIICNCLGLSNQRRSLTILHNVSSNDRTSLLAAPVEDHGIPIRAELTTGDDYVAASGIEEISFLKLDVEGAEMDVLQGFHNSFTAGKIRVVQFEHCELHVLSRHFLVDFWAFFQQFAFEVYVVYPHTVERLDYDYRVHETFVGGNYLALPRPPS